MAKIKISLYMCYFILCYFYLYREEYYRREVCVKRFASLDLYALGEQDAGDHKGPPIDINLSLEARQEAG